jgi:hypothetical protein
LVGEPVDVAGIEPGITGGAEAVTGGGDDGLLVAVRLGLVWMVTDSVPACQVISATGSSSGRRRVSRTRHDRRLIMHSTRPSTSAAYVDP